MSIISGLRRPEWIISVITGYIFHVYKYRVVGFLLDYDVDFSNTIFVLSVAMVIGDYNIWPATLRKPCYSLIIIYRILLTVLLTNVARTLIWMTIMGALKAYLPVASKMVLHFNTARRFRKFSTLFRFARWLGSDSGLHDITNLLAVGIFIWVLHSTDSIAHIKLVFTAIKMSNNSGEKDTKEENVLSDIIASEFIKSETPFTKDLVKKIKCEIEEQPLVSDFGSQNGGANL